MAGLADGAGPRAIAVGGKARRSAPGDTASGCLHPVSAWAAESGPILGREAVADGSHEIAAIPEPLRVLDPEGAPVTADAAGCRKAIAAQARSQGGDYVLAVKGSQPALARAARAALGRAAAADSAGRDLHESSGAGHGRAEERYVAVIPAPAGLPAGWADAAAVVVGREREVKGERTDSAHFDLTSLRATAELAGSIRGHWSVENGLPWCLDAAFRGDENRARDENAGANLGVVRRMAASLLEQDPDVGSTHAKRLNAALDERHLERGLRGFKTN